MKQHIVKAAVRKHFAAIAAVASVGATVAALGAPVKWW
jgi:hypothetical protein